MKSKRKLEEIKTSKTTASKTKLEKGGLQCQHVVRNTVVVQDSY